MKTKLLFFVGLISFYGLAVQAQAPTITFANTQLFGDSTIIYKSDTLGMTQGSSGASVIWDFSVLDSTGVVFRYTMSPLSTPYPTLYPSANRAERTVSGTSTNYQFYNSQNDSVTTVGTSGGVIDSTIYFNPDKTAIFPFSYQNSFYDTSISRAFYNIGGINNHSYHSRTTTADGYGTLILPNGTYTNTLRYKVVHNEVDSLFSGSNFTSRTVWYIEEYLWVDAGYRAYLLYYNPVKNKNGAPQARSIHYVTNPYPVMITNTNNLVLQNNKLQIYPNPANNELNITGATTGLVTIYNSFGQTILEQKVSDIIDFSGFAKGLYFVQVSDDKNRIIKSTKIIKE